jgi:hypothetical protein
MPRRKTARCSAALSVQPRTLVMGCASIAPNRTMVRPVTSGRPRPRRDEPLQLIAQRGGLGAFRARGSVERKNQLVAMRECLGEIALHRVEP